MDTRYKNPYIAIAPSSVNGSRRVYIGAYPDVKSAQEALEDYIKHGRPQLYGATLADIYKMWSDIHYKEIEKNDTWRSMWKWYEPLYNIKISELRTAHFQDIINKVKSKGTADKLKSPAVMLCSIAMS